MMRSKAAFAVPVILAVALSSNPTCAYARTAKFGQSSIQRALLRESGVTPNPGLWRSQNPASRSTGRTSCGKKILIGLGIGAGVGAAYGAALGGKVDEPGKFTLATTTLFGLIGAVVGSRLC